MTTLSLKIDLSEVEVAALTRQAAAGKTTVDDLIVASVRDLAQRAQNEYEQFFHQKFFEILAKATDDEKLQLLAVVDGIEARP